MRWVSFYPAHRQPRHLTLWGGRNSLRVDLTAHADKDGYIEVQKLTCLQLANTYQKHADPTSRTLSKLL
jgi:hypothetical protein